MLSDDKSNNSILDRNKPALTRFYMQSYLEFKKLLSSSKLSGKILEIGSGQGFLKSIVPEIITSDIMYCEDVDMVVNACHLPFERGELKAIFMMNTLHHIEDCELFFSEASRCLKNEGFIFIVDQHRGIFSRPILKYFHNEGYDDTALGWKFNSKGPMDANGALNWMIFVRDRIRFSRMFPSLLVDRYQPHSPLLYWLSGGLKWWTLVPQILLPIVECIDNTFLRLSPDFGSFVNTVVYKKDGQ